MTAVAPIRALVIEDSSETPRTFGDLAIDVDAREVTVCTRSPLLEMARGPSCSGDDHVVDVRVSNLQRRLRRGSDTGCRRTVLGVGYRVAEDTGR